MSDRSAVLLQYLLPKKALTQFAGFVAGGRWGGITQAIIRNFIAPLPRQHGRGRPARSASYATFNEFFTRALSDGARPLAQALGLPGGRRHQPVRGD